MTIENLFKSFKEKGINLTVENGRIIYSGPEHFLTEKLKDTIKANKQEIIEYLSHPPLEKIQPPPFTPTMNKVKKETQSINLNKEINLIDKKLVHKHHEENVFIYNLRRALPRKIDKNFFEEKILPDLSTEERTFLCKFYSIDKDFFADDTEQFYLLNTIPYYISVPKVKSLLSKKNIGKENGYLLFKYYKRDRKLNAYTSNEDISSNDALKILETINHKDWFIHDNEKSFISDILEEIPDVAKKNIFYCSMHTDPAHTFFFEHPNEHIPGMLLIEAARQLINAIMHKYFNTPHNDVSFIFRTMKVRFGCYLELNYPTKMMVTVNEIKSPPGYIYQYDFDVIVYQKAMECASINFTGDVIEKELFQMLRESQEKKGSKKPRFKPREIIAYQCSIKDTQGNNRNCSIIDLSESGFQLYFTDPIDQIMRNDSEHDFLLSIQNNAKSINGKCRVVWKNEKLNRAGFQITRITDNNFRILKEVLKLCYIREDREIV